MLDIKWIKENPQKFDESMITRGTSFRAKELLILDEEKKQLAQSHGMEKSVDLMKKLSDFLTR